MRATNLSLPLIVFLEIVLASQRCDTHDGCIRAVHNQCWFCNEFTAGEIAIPSWLEEFADSRISSACSCIGCTSTSTTHSSSTLPIRSTPPTSSSSARVSTPTPKSTANSPLSSKATSALSTTWLSASTWTTLTKQSTPIPTGSTQLSLTCPSVSILTVTATSVQLSTITAAPQTATISVTDDITLSAITSYITIISDFTETYTDDITLPPQSNTITVTDDITITATATESVIATATITDDITLPPQTDTVTATEDTTLTASVTDIVTVTATATEVTTFTATFTDDITITSTTTDDITVATTATLPASTVTVTSTSVLVCSAGTAVPNAIQNPGFESGALAPWIFQTNPGDPPPAPITDDAVNTNKPHTGSYAIFIHDDEGLQYDAFRLYQQVSDCPGRTYTFTFWAAALAANECYLQTYFNGAGGPAFQFVLGTSYQQFSTNFQVPAGATTVSIGIEDSDCFGNFYADDFSFTGAA